MSMPNPLRPLWHVGIMSGIPLLALALGTGDAAARSLERNIGAGASRKPAAPTAAGSTTGRAGAVEGWRAGTRNHDPCCADDGRTPGSAVGTPAAGSREMTPSVPQDSHARGRSVVRRGGVRVEKRSGDTRVAPRSTPGEQRRGGVGALIGITFA